MKEVESENSGEEKEDVECVTVACIISNGCRVNHVASGISQSFHTIFQDNRTIEWNDFYLQ